MRQLHDDATGRGRVVLAVAIGAVLALLLPSLLTSPTDSSGATAALAFLVLTFAALVRFDRRSVAQASRTRTAAPATAGEPPRVLPGRVTDPVHHPLRPRAPGLA